MTKDWGADWSQWRYGRINASTLDHQFIPEYSLPAIERPGGFNTVNATGANFRRIIDLSNVDNSVWTNAPGQSGQPGSPFYGNNRELLDVLYRTGEALGGAQLIHRDTSDERNPVMGPAISADWPPPAFDPPEWRTAAPPASGAQSAE